MAMKDRYWHLWPAALLFFVLRGSQAEIEVDISLEHSLDGETFTAAGTIQGSLSDQVSHLAWPTGEGLLFISFKVP